MSQGRVVRGQDAAPQRLGVRAGAPRRRRRGHRRDGREGAAGAVRSAGAVPCPAARDVQARLQRHLPRGRSPVTALGFTALARIGDDRPAMTALRPAVFLDRDGVVIEESHYLGNASRVRLVPGAGEAIAALNRAGWVVVIVTNQSGVARGLFTIESVEQVHAHLSELLRGIRGVGRCVSLLPASPRGRPAGLPSRMRVPQAETGDVAECRD